MGISPDAVQWGKVGEIVSSWVVSPVIAGTFAFVISLSIRRFVFDAPDAYIAARRYLPIYLFFVGYMISMVTLTKGLTHIGLHISFEQSLLYSALVALVIVGLGVIGLSRVKRVTRSGQLDLVNVEKIFAVMMVFTACSMAFAHGSNDVANAIGPLAAINSIIESGGVVGAKAATPSWILLLGGTGIVAGLALYGYRVIQTICTHITELTPSSGFAAELAAATTVVVASGASLPISTTHTLVGSVLCVGLARGISALNLRVVGTIFVSWLVTLPAGAVLSIVFFYVFKGIFCVG